MVGQRLTGQIVPDHFLGSVQDQKESEGGVLH